MQQSGTSIWKRKERGKRKEVNNFVYESSITLHTNYNLMKDNILIKVFSEKN